VRFTNVYPSSEEHMSYGAAEAYRALARQIADQQRKVSTRHEEIQKRVSARAGALSIPDEPLACPRCTATYPFGFHLP